MGFAVHRQVYADDIDFDYEYYVTDDQDRQPIKPVPIWLCVFLVVSYIFGGAYLFSEREDWSFLDSVYFCFITLTTIGSFFLYSLLSLRKMFLYCSIQQNNLTPIKINLFSCDFHQKLSVFVAI